MKRYIINAEFIRWKSSKQQEVENDSFQYVVELETDEEAQTRLDSLIIERMSSKPGWNYVLKQSAFTEFSGDSSSTLASDQMGKTDTNTFLPDFIPETQTLQQEEIHLETESIQPDSLDQEIPEGEINKENLENDQLMA